LERIEVCAFISRKLNKLRGPFFTFPDNFKCKNIQPGVKVWGLQCPQIGLRSQNFKIVTFSCGPLTFHPLPVIIYTQAFPFCFLYLISGWLGSGVVSVLDSGAEEPGFKSQSRHCRVTVLGKLFTPKQQKLVAALLRVAGVTAGLAESNGNLPSGL